MIKLYRKLVSPYLDKYRIQLLDGIVMLSLVVGAIYTLSWFYTTGYYPKIPKSPSPQPIVVRPVDITNILTSPVSGNVVYTNKLTNDLLSPPESFNLGDVVIIKYFEIPGVVIRKDGIINPTFDILYKDNMHELHVINLQREFLTRAKTGVSHVIDLDLSH